MFGFPQALDEQDMDGGGESEQAMLPPSLSMEYQGSKPNGAFYGFDMNSGLSVCEHLRGKVENITMCVIVLLFSLTAPSLITHLFIFIVSSDP